MTSRIKFLSTNVLAMFVVLRFRHAHLVNKRVCLGQGYSAFPCVRYRPGTKTFYYNGYFKGREPKVQGGCYGRVPSVV